MKIALECKSLLLEKALEMFLGKYISSKKLCDIIIKDELCVDDEKCFYIASNLEADLQKPFSKSQLILGLEKKYKSLQEKIREPLSFEILEKRIDCLTKEYQENIMKVVKAFYEK